MATIRYQRLVSLRVRSSTRGFTVSSFSPTPHLWGLQQFQRSISDARPLKASVSDIVPRQNLFRPRLRVAKQTRRIPVRPTGWETNKETELLPMTLLGQTMPKIYGLIIDIFKLPETISAAQQEQIVENLRQGLERTLEQYPIMTGVLEWCPESGEVGVRKNKDSAVGFEVRYMDGKEDEFPTFSQLEKRYFHAGLIKSEWVFPKFTSGLLPAEGVPAATFQLTFFRGGCALGWAVHHQLSDGSCYEQFMTLWGENSRIAAQETASPTTLSSQSSPVSFKPIKKSLQILETPLTPGNPDSERWEQIKYLFPELTEDPAPSLPEGFVFPELTTTMWHFPKAKVEQLKAETMSQVGEGKWISTYDALMGLMWQSITRARVNFLKPELDTKSVLGHMVDIRKMTGISTTEPFIGITSMPPQCGPLTVKELVDPANHAKVASTVRASINSLTSDYMKDFSQFVAHSTDKRRLRFDHKWFFGPDLGATSLMHYRSYKRHDFGFGLPRAVRWPGPLVEYVYFYPSRRGLEGADEDEGVEVCVALEKGCAERMLEDDMLRWYASPRGNEPLQEEVEDLLVENTTQVTGPKTVL